jgi:CelD/BcsL family acetyltransferase involved in cellulose biosynthesis
MPLHADWAAASFDRTPAADLVGPFPHRPFLELWWKQRGAGEPVFLDSDSALLALWHGPGGIEFMGEPDLTDYHVPLGGGLTTAGPALAEALPTGTPFLLDSLPGEVADPLEAGLESAGVTVRRAQHEVAAVLDLPAEYDEHLAGLSSKERHEVRRKRRRFEEGPGTPRIRRDGSPEAFSSFVAMHRSAPGEKGAFMTPELESFFASLLGLDGAALDLLVGDDDRPVAAVFGFEDDDAYYLYNSAYATESADVSPGVVLIDRLIERTIREGRSRFDFLKGDEPYKFKLGAAARPLFVLEGAL